MKVEKGSSRCSDLVQPKLKGGVGSDMTQVVGQFLRMRCGGKISFQEIDLNLQPIPAYMRLSVDCLFLRSPSQVPYRTELFPLSLLIVYFFKVTEPSSVPYRTHSTCAKMAMYPDPPPVIPLPDTGVAGSHTSPVRGLLVNQDRTD